MSLLMPLLKIILSDINNNDKLSFLEAVWIWGHSVTYFMKVIFLCAAYVS